MGSWGFSGQAPDLLNRARTPAKEGTHPDHRNTMLLWTGVLDAYKVLHGEAVPAIAETWRTQESAIADGSSAQAVLRPAGEWCWSASRWTSVAPWSP